MQTKDELRTIAKNIRQSLDIKIVSEKILNNFLALDCYKNAKNIAAYYSYGSEINLLPLINRQDKNFFLPVVKNGSNDMDFGKFSNEIKLKNNIWGIPEPTGEIINSDDIDIIILPALMADKSGFRLGYGKGFYDKYLSKNKLLGKKVILIPDELLIEKLPTDSFDVSADIVVTQTKVINW